MKLPVRRMAAFLFLHSVAAMQGAPLLFINHSQGPTNFASTRASELSLTHSVLGDFSAEQIENASVVIMPGITSYESLMASQPLLTAFVQTGGYLWINLAGSACAPGAAPGGAGFVQWGCGSAFHNAETINDPSHPYFTGAFAPAAHALTGTDFAEWGSTDAGHIEGAPAGAAVILSNSQGPSLTEYALGEGWVVVSTLTYGWGENGARTAAMDNMLLYAAMQIRGSENSASLPVSGVPEPSTFLLLATGAVLMAFSQGLRRH